MNEIKPHADVLASASQSIDAKIRAAAEITTLCRMGLSPEHQTAATDSGALQHICELCAATNSEDVRRASFKAIAAITLNNSTACAFIATSVVVATAVADVMSHKEGLTGRLWIESSAVAANIIVPSDSSRTAPEWHQTVLPVFGAAFVDENCPIRVLNNAITFFDRITEIESVHELLFDALPSAVSQPRNIVSGLLKCGMSPDPQISRSEACSVIGKVLGPSESTIVSMADMEYVSSVCVALLQCAVDGTKPPDASLHPTLPSATTVIAKLCSCPARYNALFDNDVVNCISRAITSVKARSDISKTRSTTSDSTSNLRRVRSDTSGFSRSNSEVSRLNLLQSLWHLSFVPEFACQIKQNTKLVKQLKVWSGDQTDAETTPRGRDEPDLRTVQASLAILASLTQLKSVKGDEGRKLRVLVIHSQCDGVIGEAIKAHLNANTKFALSQTSRYFDYDGPGSVSSISESAQSNFSKAKQDWDIACLAPSQCDVAVVCLSKSFRMNSFCRSQLQSVVRAQKAIVCVAVDGYNHDGWCKQLLGDSLFFRLSAVQSPEAKLEQLVRQIEAM